MAFNTVENPIYADPRTHEFLEAGIAEGAHLKMPPNIYSKTWVKERNILFCYYGTKAYDPDIAAIYRTMERTVKRSRLAGVRRFWENCSPELQTRFSWQTFPLNKPNSVENVDKPNPVLAKWGREHYERAGKKGGDAANKVLSHEQRSEMGKKGARKLLEERGVDSIREIGKQNGRRLKEIYGEDYFRNIRLGKKFKNP